MLITTTFGCARAKDRPRGDTDAGLIQFTDPVVVHGDTRRIAGPRPVDDDGGGRAIAWLSRSLTMDDSRSNVSRRVARSLA